MSLLKYLALVDFLDSFLPIVPAATTTIKMTRTPEAESFFRAVYAAVQEVPHGKVTSYGHIALLIGTRKSYYNVLHALLTVHAL